MATKTAPAATAPKASPAPGPATMAEAVAVKGGTVAAIVADAVQAVKASDSAFHSAAVGVAFLAAFGQTFEIRGGRKPSVAKYKDAWSHFLKAYIHSGNVAFTRPMLDKAGNPVLGKNDKPRREGCVEEATAIRLCKSPARRAELTDSLWDDEKRPKGLHLAKGLTRIKLAARAIITDIVENKGDWLADMAAQADAGVMRGALYETFARRCCERYGDTGASLEAFFQGGGAGAGFDAAKWAAGIVKRVDKGISEVPTDVLAALLAELQNRMDQRTAMAATAEAMMELAAGDAAPAEQIPEEEEGEDVALAA